MYVQTNLDFTPIPQMPNAKVSFDVIMEHPMLYSVLVALSIIPTPVNVHGLHNTNVLEMEVGQQQRLHLLQQLQEHLLLQQQHRLLQCQQQRELRHLLLLVPYQKEWFVIIQIGLFIVKVLSDLNDQRYLIKLKPIITYIFIIS